MKTKTITVYSFDELSEESQNKALSQLWDLNVMDSFWYESVFEDAERIGIKITGFDIERRNTCEGNFIDDSETVANKILAEHGEQCETYKTAKKFLDAWSPLYKELQGLEESEELYGYMSKRINELDAICTDLIDQFEHDLFEDYRIILRNEFEYQTSREQIIESIKANEYTFTEDGKLCN